MTAYCWLLLGFRNQVSPFVRSISSGAYNFLRWAGAALAPVLSGLVGQSFGMKMPFWLAAVVLLAGLAALTRSGSVYREALAAGHPPA